MKTFHLVPNAPSYRLLRDAAAEARKGGILIYPTDTVYGLGCDVFSKEAIKRIGQAKERKENKPFSFICKDIAQISEFAFVSNWAYRLMTRTLPGPYTFILEARRTQLPKRIIGKRNTVGVRIPDHPVCRALVDLLNGPLVTTSVNLADGEPLVDPEELPPAMARFVDIALSEGPLLNDPSTVVDLTGSEPITIREGSGPIDW